MDASRGTEASVTPGENIALGLVVVFLLGGMGLLSRRFAEARWGPAPPRDSFWFRKGFLFAPDWLYHGVAMIGTSITIAGIARAVME